MVQKRDLGQVLWILRWGMSPMVRLELTTLSYKLSTLAIEVTSSKAITEKELSLSSWCIASLYIYHFSTVVDFSPEKYTEGFASSSPIISIMTVNLSAGTRSSYVQ